MSDITIKINGKDCAAKSGQTIVEAAKANGIYIPTLCNYEGLKPAGTCRICTVKVGGRNMAACTTPVGSGMVIESNTAELEELRKAIVEMLFVEGNHMCPTCEKSGNCELQALGYRYRMMVPRFPYIFPVRTINAMTPKIYIDGNRCIQCLRCVRAFASPDGRKMFGQIKRSGKTMIGVDQTLAAGLTDEQAQKAMDMCPVGSILRKEVGFKVPIGSRIFDLKQIGSEIEK